MKKPMPMMKKRAEASGGSATDEKLFEMLKELRQKEAKKESLASICDFPGKYFAGYGHTLSHHTGRTGKMPGCK